MLIGAWKSFFDLEDNLTLDELFELYGEIMEKEQEDFKRDAALQGVQIPDEPQEQEEETVFERARRKRAHDSGDTSKIAQAEFGEGQGYQIIGG